MTRPKTRTAARTLPMKSWMNWTALLSLGIGVIMAGAVRAQDTGTTVSHGYSFYGDLSYPADYPHFDYVNPDAPKGGEIAIAFVGSLDSMNPYSGKGRAHLFSVFGYESLLGEAPSDGLPADQYSEAYCLLCESVEYPEDKSWVIFRMRPEARFSDGAPVTAHDIAFSHNLLLDEGLKSYADAVRKRIPKVEVIDDHTIKFYFADGISRRSLIEQVGGVPAWPKEWMEKNGVGLKDSWLTSPPGSGPYVIKDIDLTRRIVLERNPDYWGKDLPINQGRNNFDTIRLEIFSDDTASFEAFKAGEYTFRRESDSKKWAAGYDFPKVERGQVVKKELPDGQPPSSSGIIFNLASENLQDKRVREAISLAFNFEWTNESLQYGLFKQRASFSQDTPLMAQGKPEGAELALLQKLGDLVPPEMLSEEVRVPHTSKGDRLFDRRNARRAGKLLEEAGWTIKDGKRVNAEGEPLSLNFLFNSASSATITAVIENFVSNLQAFGIDAKLEKVDSSQYTARERDRDYDLIYDSYPAFLGTGTGLAQYFGSEAASYSLFNPAGVASKLVDELIEVSLAAQTREEETAAMMAIDRALRQELIMIPVWYNDSHWVAYYDQYEHPEEIPAYGLGYLDFWWYNPEKAAALRASGALR
ncbi:ABC transporter substrate-binding protein [Sulfitobacter mediterraneus]|uniref:extracellular solute-binding protein n=1 Tax=Sulfitobacter mediterraneus TaxID=83219 RepID=UPI001933A975|nr:ABC transporter substrate-binding protein [Sulfitobacter mediterraneus]MBM1640537.1 ABC transporter substrate-binding protein [Sulfitobacter mediterraneus]MBM1645194.1 ABC transporter substrate-binding protein [Sulfitobacter mediterraneus]MBM1648657.1 ABC transporter substrate-binding protein [Sulfitobacter mediterraneus]MBM1652678.1 ABC transporter substrate-binding protein [Sulfitobacter mediterraneus]